MLERLSDALWSPWLLGLFLLVGGAYTVCTGGFQLWGAGKWLGGTMGKHRKADRPNHFTQAQALNTALASTIGTGSIAGVATAIFYGGPGAVFWMWVSALLGMMTGFAEKLLAVKYRERAPGGGWQGGPMCYIRRGLGVRWLAAWFSLACVCSSLCGGNMVQVNSIAYALQDSLGLERWLTGILLAGTVGVVMAGGLGRIGRVSERLVPVMAFLYLGSGALVLFRHRERLPAALALIVGEAFRPRGLLGGALGYGMAKAMRYGIARGVFTNEAGMGSSAMAHAAADVQEPAEEGLWGIFEVFVATLLICTVTALAILTSGVYAPQSALEAIRSGAVPGTMVGAPLTAAAFGSVLGRAGSWVISVSLVLFAFTSVLGWSYYGERGLGDLLGGRRGRGAYRLIFLACILLGSVGEVGAVWQLADLLNGLMALPNLIALLLLLPEVLRDWRGWRQTKKPPCTR